jgi:pyroglutamyl-peptidase
MTGILRRNRGSCALITGFGRFPGAAFNPSGPIARTLGRIRRPALSGLQLVSHVFPTSYAAVDRDLPLLLKQHRPDIVLMFGLAARSKNMRIEILARNALSRFPDAERVSPAARRIVRGAAPMKARAPIRRMLRAARQSQKTSTLSRNAGGYLCNYLYWRALEAAALPGGPALVAFVHVPSTLRPGTRPSPRHPRRPSVAALSQAAESILRAMAAALPRIRH